MKRRLASTDCTLVCYRVVDSFVYSSCCFLNYATGGAGGKGTWGKLLAADGELELDRNDPNYDSEEV